MNAGSLFESVVLQDLNTPPLVIVHVVFYVFE